MMKKIVYVYGDESKNSQMRGQNGKMGHSPQGRPQNRPQNRARDTPQNAKKYLGNTPRVGCGTWATDIGTENCTIYDRPY